MIIVIRVRVLVSCGSYHIKLIMQIRIFTRLEFVRVIHLEVIIPIRICSCYIINITRMIYVIGDHALHIRILDM